MVTSLKPRRFQRTAARVKKRYSSDVTEAEWQIIRPLLPLPKARGRKREVDEREVLNGIFYQIRNGCVWSDLPKDLPAWQTVYKYLRRWQRNGVWQQIHDTLRREVRASVGKQPQASAGSIDSQSVKTTEKRGKSTASMAENASRGASGLSSSIGSVC
jgi:putative transposase